MQIRQATLNDVGVIARIHVDSWRTTYAGIVPDELLANLSVENREKMWREILSNSGSRSTIFVAVDDDGKLIGSASCGPEREGNPAYKGELYSIYLLKANQGAGVGRALARAVAKWLLESGYDTMLVKVLKVNPACKFYEHIGGRYVSEKEVEIGGAKLIEVAYGWPDIRTLLRDQ